MLSLKPNLDRKGRWARALLGLALAVIAVAAPAPMLLKVFLAIGAAFVLWEAAQGWCALRACGVKTKI